MQISQFSSFDAAKISKKIPSLTATSGSDSSERLSPVSLASQQSGGKEAMKRPTFKVNYAAALRPLCESGGAASRYLARQGSSESKFSVYCPDIPRSDQVEIDAFGGNHYLDVSLAGNKGESRGYLMLWNYSGGEINQVGVPNESLNALRAAIENNEVGTGDFSDEKLTIHRSESGDLSIESGRPAISAGAKDSRAVIEIKSEDLPQFLELLDAKGATSDRAEGSNASSLSSRDGSLQDRSIRVDTMRPEISATSRFLIAMMAHR